MQLPVLTACHDCPQRCFVPNCLPCSQAVCPDPNCSALLPGCVRPKSGVLALTASPPRNSPGVKNYGAWDELITLSLGTGPSVLADDPATRHLNKQGSGHAGEHARSLVKQASGASRSSTSGMGHMCSLRGSRTTAGVSRVESWRLGLSASCATP